MIVRRRQTHVVLDTDVTSWLLDPRPSQRGEAARGVVAGRARVVSFVTLTEIRFGALRGGWGELRFRRLERSLADLEVIDTNNTLILRCAAMRADLQAAGHGLAQKVHEADRWVAATAMALGLELVAGDGIFADVPGLEVHRITAL